MLKKFIPGSLFADFTFSGFYHKNLVEMKAAISDVYANKVRGSGLRPGGSVASGIMAGYNPVCRWFIKHVIGRCIWISSKCMWTELRAYQQRINLIKNTLAKKFALDEGIISGDRS
jgi:hypothetical protein